MEDDDNPEPPAEPDDKGTGDLFRDDPEAFVKFMRDSDRRVAADVFRLRGELLSAAASLELMMDIAIEWFFEVPKPKSPSFRFWLMRQLTVVQKIQVLRRILTPGRDDFMAQLLRRLEEANTFRNSVAHSAVSVVPTGDSLRVTSSHLKKSGAHRVETDPAELERWLVEMEKLVQHVLIVAMQILCGPQPFDAQATDWPSYIQEVCPKGILHAPNRFLDAFQPYVEEDNPR